MLNDKLILSVIIDCNHLVVGYSLFILPAAAAAATVVPLPFFFNVIVVVFVDTGLFECVCVRVSLFMWLVGDMVLTAHLILSWSSWCPVFDFKVCQFLGVM